MNVDNANDTQPVITKSVEGENSDATELSRKIEELSTELKNVNARFAGFIKEIERQFVLVKRAINSNVHAVYRVILTHNKAFHDQPELCVNVECKRSDEDGKDTTEKGVEKKTNPEATSEAETEQQTIDAKQ